MKRPVGRCWVDPSYKVDKDGYVRITSSYYGRHSAMIVVWKAIVGSWPKGLVPDHLCGNHACYNPAHIEPVTPTENSRRRGLRITHCPKGHEYTEENTYVHRGKRSCLDCRRERKKTPDQSRRHSLSHYYRYHERNKAKQLERYHNSK